MKSQIIAIVFLAVAAIMGQVLFTPNGWEDAVVLYNVEPTVLTTPQVATSQNLPNIVHTLCIDDALVLWHRRSTNFGFHWEQPTQISIQNEVVEDGYQIVADSRGYVYAVWFQGAVGQYTLRFSYSTNNGEQWSLPRNIDGEIGILSFYDPPLLALTVDGADTVRMVFIYKSNEIAPVLVCYSQFFYNNSSSIWTSYETIHNIGATPEDARGRSICAIDNIPHVAFGFKPNDDDNLPGTLYHSVRCDVNIWLTNIIADINNAYVVRPRQVILRNDDIHNNLHVVFESYRRIAGGTAYIYYSRSTDCGNSWLKNPISLFGSANWFKPTLAINGTEIKVVTFYRPKQQLHCQISTNSGLDWQSHFIFTVDCDFPWLTSNAFGYYLMFKELGNSNADFTAYYDTLFTSTNLATAENTGRHLYRVPEKNLFNLVYESKGKIRYTRSEGNFTDWQPFHKIDVGGYPSVGYVYVPFGPIQPESAACVAYQSGDEIRYRWLYEPTGSWFGFSILPSGTGLISGPPSLITVGYNVCVVYPVYNPEHLPQYPFASAIYFNEFRYDASEPGPTTVLAQSNYFDLRFPSITLDGNYDLHVVWEDNDDGQIWYRMRMGGFWRPPECVDEQGLPDPSSTPFVETYGDRVYCDWTEYPSGEETEIYENFTDIGLGDWPNRPANISKSPSLPSYCPVSCIGDFTVWAEQNPPWDYDIRYYSKTWGYGWVNESPARSFYPHSQLWTDTPTEYWYLYTAFTEGNQVPYQVATIERQFPSGKGGNRLPIYYKVITGETSRSRFCTKRDTIIRYNGYNVDYGKEELIYTLDFLDPRFPAYRAFLVTYFEGVGNRTEKVLIDSIDYGTFEFQPNRPETISITIPRTLYWKDHKVIVSLKGNPVTKAGIILFQLEKAGSFGGGIQTQSLVPASDLTRLDISPNPAKGIVNIAYNTPKPLNISICLFDITGRMIEKVYTGLTKAGNNFFTIKTKGLANGIYFLKLKSGKETITKKVILMR
ncbi:MAG: T9SS type A sorting domain-containing protein [candidate division WOR-3 bacterium]